MWIFKFHAKMNYFDLKWLPRGGCSRFSLPARFFPSSRDTKKLTCPPLLWRVIAVDKKAFPTLCLSDHLQAELCMYLFCFGIQVEAGSIIQLFFRGRQETLRPCPAYTIRSSSIHQLSSRDSCINPANSGMLFFDIEFQATDYSLSQCYNY